MNSYKHTCYNCHKTTSGKLGSVVLAIVTVAIIVALCFAFAWAVDNQQFVV